MRKWLRETHGVTFELVRHFLWRFFDSDLITSPEQTRSALLGCVGILLPWFQLLIGPLREKYAHFNSLPSPGPYRAALRSDELWLITLSMAAVGLLTAIKWQSLFPDLRDYRVLGALPLRPRQLFLAKLLALFAVAAAASAAINFMPSTVFPALSQSRWAFPSGNGARMSAMALAGTAGCAFFLFGLVALQGVLLNLLRPRAFRRVTATLQGLLVGVMLGLIVLSFSIQPHGSIDAAALVALAAAGVVPRPVPKPLRQSRPGHVRARLSRAERAADCRDPGAFDLRHQLSPPPHAAG